MFKRTRMIVLARLYVSGTGMAFEVDESRISTPDEAIAALQAGNVEDINMIDSFEFAAALKGVKAIVIMGHTACGAVGGACHNAKLGNLTLLLDEIQPAVELVKHEHSNENA